MILARRWKACRVELSGVAPYSSEKNKKSNIKDILSQKSISCTASEGLIEIGIRRAPRRVMAIFLLGLIIVLIGFLVILLHQLAGWFTLGMALLIMFASIAIGSILWVIAWVVARKLGITI